MSYPSEQMLSADIEKYFSNIKLDRAPALEAHLLAPNILFRAPTQESDLIRIQGCSRALLVSPPTGTSAQAIGELFSRFGFITMSQVQDQSSYVIEYQDIQSAMQSLSFLQPYSATYQTEFIQPLESCSYLLEAATIMPQPSPESDHMLRLQQQSLPSSFDRKYFASPSESMSSWSSYSLASTVEYSDDDAEPESQPAKIVDFPSPSSRQTGPSSRTRTPDLRYNIPNPSSLRVRNNNASWSRSRRLSDLAHLEADVEEVRNRASFPSFPNARPRQESRFRFANQRGTPSHSSRRVNVEL
jgi:hypothetical protein